LQSLLKERNGETAIIRYDQPTEALIFMPYIPIDSALQKAVVQQSSPSFGTSQDMATTLTEQEI